MKFPKLIICAIVLCTFVCSTHSVLLEGVTKHMEILEACRNQIGASTDDLKVITEFQIPSTRIQHCLISCFGKKTGVMGVDNSLKYDKIVEVFGPTKQNPKVYEIFDNMIKECIKLYIPEKDECNSVKQFMDCRVKFIEKIN